MSKAKVIYRFQATLIDVLVCSIFIFLTMLIGGNLDLIEAVINETSISIDSYEYFNFDKNDQPVNRRESKVDITLKKIR